MSNQPTSGLPPSLIISSRDLARLEALLDSPVLSRHPAAIALMDELNRAEVLAVRNRLSALGTQGTRPPIPKGIDPNKARPNHKAMRGR